MKRQLGALAATAALLALAASPSVAAGAGSIDHVEPGSESVQVLFSIPSTGAEVVPSLDSLAVTVNGEPVEASASLAGDSTETVRRTAVLAIDVSKSMNGEKFTQAKLAAKAFLDTVPDDVYVGMVTFAGEVQTVAEPALDRGGTVAALDELTLSVGTRLNQGVTQAVDVAGEEGQRSVLVLSDGKDTSKSPLSDVLTTIGDAEVKVDVVSLGQAVALEPLEEMANAGSGTVLQADPAALSKVFADEADALARQVLIEAQMPSGFEANEGTLAVSVEAAGETYSDEAFVTLLSSETSTTEEVAGPSPVAPPAFAISQGMMLLGLAAIAAGGLVVLLLGLGVFDRNRTETLEERIAAYGRTKDPRAAAGTPGVRLADAPRPDGLTGSAVGVAQKALASNKSFEAKLGTKLEAAGMALKPAEWLLIHAGVAVGGAMAGFLLSSGGILLTLVMLVVGLVGPWLFLGFKRRRRLKAFNAQLADTLQLMSGSLSAGLSLAQSVDTVVREGTDPLSSEFRRALVETRLGVQIEDSLESVAERMESDDFKWVVMAIRIQRDVGGNLAELLLSVAGTLREREYLRRQVRALSAEGRLSAWILGGLPPVFLLYLALTNFEYVEPMFTSLLGWVMVGTMTGMMIIGAFWLSKTVKVEV